MSDPAQNSFGVDQGPVTPALNHLNELHQEIIDVESYV